jgi:hypothetical protein
MRVKRTGTDSIPDNPPTPLTHTPDKLRVELVVGVPRPARQRAARLEAFEHVNLARDVLDGLHALDEPLLGEGLEASVDHGLVQRCFGFEVFRPYSCFWIKKNF